jgi:DNA-binding transcriptional ArsR family regulator
MPFEDDTTRILTDPRAMRALAHPTRVALLEFLLREGPLTATRAGELLGQSPASCSFHLRQLAKYGFVEEAPGGKGRERPWRRVSVTLSWSAVSPDAETDAAGEVLTEVAARRNLEHLEEWFRTRRSFPPEWQVAGEGWDSLLYLTLDELKEFNLRIRDLAFEYLDRVRDPSRRPKGSRPVEFLAYTFPLPPTPSEEGR